MKKIFTFILSSLILAGGTFAQGKSKTAVVYYSATGTTERMAKSVASEMTADIFEIQPVHKYTDADLNWHDKKSLTTIECNDSKARPAIKDVVSANSTVAFDISLYDTVIVCYPIWWAYAPKIMYTFAESQKWDGKKLITLCTSGGSGLGRSGTDLAKFAKGCDFKGGKDFTRGSGAEIKKYVDGILK